MGSPHGEFAETDTGPDGFERWWALYPKAEFGRKAGGLKIWMEQNLETEADDIFSFTAHKMGTRAWLEDDGFFIPLPRKFLRAGTWRKWAARQFADSRAKVPPPGSREAVPRTAASDISKADAPYRYVMACLADDDLTEERKEQIRKEWNETHPSEPLPEIASESSERILS